MLVPLPVHFWYKLKPFEWSIIQRIKLFPISFRQATTFPEAWGNVDASSAEKVRGLPDVVGKTGFP